MEKSLEHAGPAFSRHGQVRLISACAVLTLPWITTRLYTAWMQSEQSRPLLVQCRHFTRGDTVFGWQVADQLLS